MELRLLRYFLTVTKEQSFTKAAEQLHITQPTLSRQMAAFEAVSYTHLIFMLEVIRQRDRKANLAVLR